jgi:hypothetical protein
MKKSNGLWNLRDSFKVGLYGCFLVLAGALLAYGPPLKAQSGSCCGDPTEGCGIVYQWPCGSDNGCVSQCCPSETNCNVL